MENITKQWYVVNTHSGHENKVADNLRKTIDLFNLKDFISDIVVAEHEETVVNKKTGVKKRKKNLYSGYIFVKAVMNENIWYTIRSTQGVTGISGAGNGRQPTPISDEEMEPILKRVGRVENNMYYRYNVGDLVKIIGGPFVGSEGRILNIDKNTGICQIETVFFGRPTPTDVDFANIEKI